MKNLQLLPWLLCLALLSGCDQNINSSGNTEDHHTLTIQVEPDENSGSIEPGSGQYESGNQLTIEALAADDWVFEEWKGDLSGTETPASLLIDSDKNITAVFRQNISERNITIHLVNQVLDTPAEGVRADIHDLEGNYIADGLMDGGRFELMLPNDSISQVHIQFSGTGYHDFSEDLDITSEQAYHLTIEPAEITLDSEWPELDPNGTEIDVRNFIFSSDPDTDQPLELRSAEITAPGPGLEIENPEPFIYWLRPLDSSRSFVTAGWTATTAANSRTGTVSIPVRAAPPEPEPEPEHLVIMPLGDSMTNDSRSRVELYTLLTGDGHTVNYVGNQYQPSSIPEPWHEGVGGIKIGEIMAKAESLMLEHQPGYINLMVGTNDIAWYFNETGQQIADRWNQLAGMLIEYSGPEAWIIAATIPPVSSSIVGDSRMQERDRAVIVADYNAALREHVTERVEAGDRIILADMEAGLDASVHLWDDGVHLNGEGYQRMGQIYYDAITKILADSN